MRIVHLLIATLGLIAQMGGLASVCGCPEVAPVVAQATAIPVAQSVCSMSGHTDCACCTQSETEQSIGEQISQLRAPCAVAVASAAHESLVLATSAEPLSLFDAILPAELDIKVVRWSPVDTGSVYLVVPRIRPPDPRAHGLRAPPLS